MTSKKNPLALLVTVVLLSSVALPAASKNTPGFFPKKYIKKESWDTIPGKDTAVMENGVYKFVDTKASFPGGTKGLLAYLQKNANPNTPVEHGAREGKYTVYIQFTVDTNGVLSDFKKLTSHGFGMEDEVLQFLQKSPPWVPAEKNGRKVKSSLKFPFTFEMKSQ